MYITKDKLTRASRLGLGILISFAISVYFNIPDNSWIYISLLVVTSEQSNIGGVLNRSYLRAFATISSAIYGILIIWMFNNNDVMNLIAVCFGLFVYLNLYMGTPQSYIGTLGSITLTIVFFNNNSLADAFMRPFNVLIGITIGLFVSYLFYPHRATTKIIANFKAMIEELNSLTQKIECADLKDAAIYNKYLESESFLLNAIADCQSLISDARLETLRVPEFLVVCNETLSILRRMIRYYSSTIYSIVSHKMKSDIDVKPALDVLMQIFTTLHNDLVINFNNFNHTIVVKRLSQLDHLIKNNATQHHFLLTMVEFIINESKELSDKFTDLRKICPRVKF